MDTNLPPIATLLVELRALAALPTTDAPRWIAAGNNVLALSTTDLLALLHREAAANPALEVVQQTLRRAAGTRRAPRAAPDVIITRIAGTANQRGFAVQIAESTLFMVRVRPAELRRWSAATAPGDPGNPGGALAEAERQRLRERVACARLYIALIHRRQRALEHITECLIELQWDALRCGGYLLPLARAAVAFRVGMHEATLSRAIAGKCAQLPTGAVVPFSRFFQNDPSIVAAIQALVAREVRPLSDDELAVALRRQDIIVASGTVAEYRERAGIPPVAQRWQRMARASAPAPGAAPITPAARAQELLNDLLDPHERESLARYGYLDVPSPGHPGRFYRIPRHSGRVRLFEGGVPVSDLCVVSTQALPRADVVLMHKLLIQGDEEAYLSSANHFPVWVPRRYVAPTAPAAPALPEALAQWLGTLDRINPTLRP